MHINFSAVQQQFQSKITFNQLNTPPQFGILSQEVKDVLAKTQESSEEGNDYLFKIITIQLSSLCTLIEDPESNTFNIKGTLREIRANELARKISTIQSKELLNRVMRHFDDEQRFVRGHNGNEVEYDTVMYALVQKSAELYDPMNNLLSDY